MPELIQFRFDLDSVDDIVPWGERGNRRLHWFGLTSGRYWIETKAGDALTYTPEVQRLWSLSSSRVDYQVARWLEDLEECLPNILEAVPEDIAEIICDSSWLRRVALWRDEATDDQETMSRWDLYDGAARWLHDREIDTAYLKHGPILSFWRTGERVHLRWTVENNHEGATPVFSLPFGHCEMVAGQFQNMAYGFCKEVLSAMRKRVESILSTGSQRTDCELNVTELVSEQSRREDILESIQVLSPGTNWDLMRTNLTKLRERVNG